MMGRLELWAEAISGEFKFQVVGNTLWTFSTMVTKAGEWMLGQLEP
jgi:hypothetical protein